ncbi:uncharacterized protein LOC143661361 isoform X3 [Tamandua tetradactyla]|uniref:uncharacterized protein LOC143661361 isoform X3 n=1 Tax=Tamandua tetradactyla TaxID=48850 RepID=UPI004053D6DD
MAWLLPVPTLVYADVCHPAGEALPESSDFTCLKVSSLSLTTWSYHLPRSRQDCGAIAECARSSSLREQGCAIKPKLSFKEYVGINRLQDREKKRKELHAVISLSAGFCI